MTEPRRLVTNTGPLIACQRSQGVGTLRILLNAKQADLLDRVDDLIPAMRQNGYWLHDQLVDAALREAGER